MKYYKKSMENYNSREIFCFLILYFILSSKKEENSISSMISKLPLEEKIIFNYTINICIKILKIN